VCIGVRALNVSAQEAFVRKSLEMDIEDLMERESVAGSVQQH
jgi:hypothetical protein